MASQRPRVVVTRKLPDLIETRMMELFDAHLNLNDQPFTRDELLNAAQTADVLVPTVTDRIDSDILLNSGAQLKLVANYGTGVDHIDLQSAKKKNITVTNTPDVLTDATAEIAMLLILGACRRANEGIEWVKKKNWQ